jgi:formimidoylglutamase
MADDDKTRMVAGPFAVPVTVPVTVPFSVPFVRPGVWPAIRRGTFAATIDGDSPEGCAVALLGLPDDTGVRLNGGRPGAAEGPAAFRAALARFGTTFDLGPERPLAVHVFDAGDVEPSGGGDEAALEQTHARVEAAVGALHARGMVTVAVGGGHDLTYPAVAAVAAVRGRGRGAGRGPGRGPALGGVNLDAHLDVRERVGSGMAFRRLIAGGHLDPRAFVEVGLGRFVNDADDVAWLRAQGAHLLTADAILDQGLAVESVLEEALAPGLGFVSIDLDGIDGAAAPGVSALNPCGLGVRHACRLAEAAGRDARVAHFDIMELCPRHDEAGRTARIAALLWMSFIAGFAARAEAAPSP